MGNVSFDLSLNYTIHVLNYINLHLKDPLALRPAIKGAWGISLCLCQPDSQVLSGPLDILLARVLSFRPHNRLPTVCLRTGIVKQSVLGKPSAESFTPRQGMGGKRTQLQTVMCEVYNKVYMIMICQAFRRASLDSQINSR